MKQQHQEKLQGLPKADGLVLLSRAEEREPERVCVVAKIPQGTRTGYFKVELDDKEGVAVKTPIHFLYQPE